VGNYKLCCTPYPAKNCCKTLFPQDEFIEVGKSDFLGGIIFEFKNLSKHILIAFYPAKDNSVFQKMTGLE